MVAFMDDNAIVYIQTIQGGAKDDVISTYHNSHEGHATLKETFTLWKRSIKIFVW